jgi:hypothetical protein
MWGFGKLDRAEAGPRVKATLNRTTKEPFSSSALSGFVFAQLAEQSDWHPF